MTRVTDQMVLLSMCNQGDGDRVLLSVHNHDDCDQVVLL